MDNFYAPKEIAELLGISYQNALLFIRFSGINYTKIGRQYRVRKDIFEQFTEKTTTTILE